MNRFALFIDSTQKTEGVMQSCQLAALPSLECRIEVKGVTLYQE